MASQPRITIIGAGCAGSLALVAALLRRSGAGLPGRLLAGLAMVVPVFALRAVQLAWMGRIEAHRRIVRYAYPVWLYVSITGVVVYAMLYHWPR